MTDRWIRSELKDSWEKWDEALKEVKQEVNRWLEQVGPLPETEEEVKKDLWVLEGLISSLGRLRDLSRSMLAELLLLRLCSQSSSDASKEEEYPSEELPFMH